ncbi:MAG TPA: hypothetical protein IGR64_02725 [Leptolyngbyaceae cyanobacterium M65_K2018_010]|nr:hypothetical protein [Leptolyngbyaceae cyanobacterium M65_K2018_010]
MPSLNSSYTPLYDPAQIPLSLDPVSRWEVFTRLKDLAIPCDCRVNAPLTVTAHSPAAIAQVWSVVQACVAPKADLVDHLNRCWQQRIHP